MPSLFGEGLFGDGVFGDTVTGLSASGARMVGYSASYVRAWSVFVSLLDAIGSENDTLLDAILEVVNGMVVVQAPDWRLPWFEEMLGLTIGDDLTRLERESRILGRMRAWQSPTAFNLRSIGLAYPSGDTEAIMNPDTWEMTYRFISTFGRPTNIDDLQAEYLRATDAHVYVLFDYRYLLRGEIFEQVTLRGDITAAGITRDQLKETKPEDLP